MVIGAILVTGASLTASVLVVQVAVLPLVFKYNKNLQRKMVFSNCINFPRNLDYDNPSSCNIVGGRNFTIEFQSLVDKCPIKIGVWHIVPCCIFRDVFVVPDCTQVDAQLFEELRKTKNTIVLYCHGNSNHRASPHRLQIYKFFQEMNFHVITFDYRGYGDSTHIRPTEKGVVEDAFQVYSWLMESLDGAKKPSVILWGHSLAFMFYNISLRRPLERPLKLPQGTAVISHMVEQLPTLCAHFQKPPYPPPSALVLEAPFNNLVEEVEAHPFSKLVSWLPYYHDVFVKPYAVSSEYRFQTDQYLARIPHVPVLILHSKGDKIVPFDLAVKLYETAKESREGGGAPLVLHAFEKGLGLGHNNLCESKELRDIVTNFLDLVKSEKNCDVVG